MGRRGPPPDRPPDGMPPRTPFGSPRRGPGRAPDGYQVVLWDTDNSEEPIATLVEARFDHGRTHLPLVAVGPEGSDWIATGWMNEQDVDLWDPEDGEKYGETIKAQMGATALALGVDGVMAVAGPGAIRLWELETGRELRVMTRADVVSDLDAHQLAKDISKRIEAEMQYPGHIKVVVIRETRAVEVAK